MAEFSDKVEWTQGEAGVSEQFTPTPAQVVIAVCMRLGLPFNERAFGNPGFAGQAPLPTYDVPNREYKAVNADDYKARTHDVLVATELRALHPDVFGEIFTRTFSAIEFWQAEQPVSQSPVAPAES